MGVMSEDEADSLKAKRKEMEQKEADVAKVEELANDLEARLYSITEKLDDGVRAEAEKVEKAWGKVEEFKTWWEKKDSQQDALAAHEAPAYRCKDAEKQAQGLVEEFDKLRKTKKPKEKKNATDKNATEKKDKDKKKDKKDKKKDKKDKMDKKKKEKAEQEEQETEQEEPLTVDELKAKIEALTAAKAEAVEKEDYDLAADLKPQLKALEEKLASALEADATTESNADETTESNADETPGESEL